MSKSHPSSLLPGWRPSLPLLVVLSGPSGSGKSSVIEQFLQQSPDFVMSVSATTRPPRGKEEEGVAYFFMSEERFAATAAEGGFLEYATVFGRHSYGTPRAFVEERMRSGQSVIMDIDVQGAAQIRHTLPQAVQIFIAAPSQQELEQRLRNRASDDSESIERRLAEAARESERWQDFDYLIINSQLDQAVQDLQAIIHSNRLRCSCLQAP